MDKNLLEKTQKNILDLVTNKYPQVYLVGGTAISLLYHHRLSEDLDFFTQVYSSKLHRQITAYIGKETGFKFNLVEEEKRKKYLPMAVYEFQVGKDVILKVDFVSDYVKVLKPRQKNGIASLDDIYYRKMLAVVGWKAGESETGRMLAGGRQKTKDLYDVFFLSKEAQALSVWFPEHFDLKAYERLTAWYLGIPKSRAVMELLELVPGCDVKLLFKHLDDEIIGKLNKRYSGV
jgi:predicted nucleotidyltransferase component of viral defense system